MRRFRSLPLVLLLLLPILSLSTGHAQGSSGYWQRVDLGLPPEYTLNGVFMVDGTDGAWIAADDGSNGLVLRLRRTRIGWTHTVEAGATAPLRSIVALADDDVWAVGDKGIIMHKSRDGWTLMPGINPNANLLTIQMFGPHEGWAAGLVPGSETVQPQPVLLHFDGNTWQEDRSLGATGSVTDIHFAAGTGYLSGFRDVWRYGNTWAQEEVPCFRVGFACRDQLYAIRALSADEAWAVGMVEYGYGSTIYVIHRVDGRWQGPVGDDWIADRQGELPTRAALEALSFGDAQHGFAVGWQLADLGVPFKPVVIAYQPDGRWHYETLPYVEDGQLLAVSHADPNHALAVGTHGLILDYGYTNVPPAPWPTPTPSPIVTVEPTPTLPPYPPSLPATNPNLPDVLYFPETQHSLQGGFKVYWEEHGGLQQFGYPLTEEYDEPYNQLGRHIKVQYFERAKFEWHPANRPPYDILLALLGNEVTVNRRYAGEAPFLPTAQRQESGYTFFPETQHNMAPEFLSYWQNTGGLPVYGYPISEPFMETSQADGNQYLVQYFERNRLEYHPELPEQYRVSLGLLGTEVLKRYGWLP